MSRQIHPPRILKVSCGAIAQLGERVTGSHEVDGSIPSSSTILHAILIVFRGLDRVTKRPVLFTQVTVRHLGALVYRRF